MDFLLCADRKVIPGVHVTAASILSRLDRSVTKARFTVFSDSLNDADYCALRRTLERTGRSYQLETRKIDVAAFAGLPDLNGSLATYYRLHAAREMQVDRFVYVDVDTVCETDLSVLGEMPLGSAPAALVPEAPLAHAVDRAVAIELGNPHDRPYFNAGVILVNGSEWRRQNISERSMEYIAAKRPLFHDQSALNVILHGKAQELSDRFNCITNLRRNWKRLKQGVGGTDALLHYLDRPKPWDGGAAWVHPFYRHWQRVFERTELGRSGKWPSGKVHRPFSKTTRTAYQRQLKDRLLFSLYARGWMAVKGTTS